jgi:hypothetical protein
VRSTVPGLLAGFLLVPGLLGAASGGIVSPSAGERLFSGDVVEVRWESLPADAVEGELLLTIEGSARFSLRVGPRLDPSARSTWWVVPALPAGSARLRLRAGFEGREVECEPGGAFEIVSRPGSAPASFLLRDDEWWLAGEALPVSRLDSPCALRPFSDEDSLAALLEDSKFPAEVAANETANRPSSSSRPLRLSQGHLFTSLPLSIPMRE